MKRSAKKMSILAMLVAIGVIMQILESFVPVVMIVPGYKIGLANITGLYALYVYGKKDMVWVTSLRIFLAALGSGSLFSVSFLLSVSGGICSMIVMVMLYNSHLFSIFGVSVGGAASHAAGQVAAITWIYQQYFMQLYLPALLALSIVSGLCVAWLTLTVIKRLEPKKAAAALTGGKHV